MVLWDAWTISIYSIPLSNAEGRRMHSIATVPGYCNAFKHSFRPSTSTHWASTRQPLHYHENQPIYNPLWKLEHNRGYFLVLVEEVWSQQRNVCTRRYNIYCTNMNHHSCQSFTQKSLYLYRYMTKLRVKWSVTMIWFWNEISLCECGVMYRQG